MKRTTRDQGTLLMIWEEKRGSPGAGFVMLTCFSALVSPLFLPSSLSTSQANRLLRFDLLGFSAGADIQKWGRGHACSACKTESITECDLVMTVTRDLKSFSHQNIFLTMKKSIYISHFMYSSIGVTADHLTRKLPLLSSLRMLPGIPML